MAVEGDIASIFAVVTPDPPTTDRLAVSGMRVAFDVTPALIGHTGVARYVTELRRELLADGVDVHPFALGRTGQHPAGVRRRPVPLRVLHAAFRTRLPLSRWLAGPFDVLHATDMVPPPTRQPVVITVHDLQAIEHPRLHDRRRTAIQHRQVAAARRAAVTIADSRSTADALVRHGVTADRIRVIHPGVRPLPRTDAMSPRAPFFLAVGTVEARKGLDTLVRAYSDAQLAEVDLIIAGPPGNATAAIDKLVEQLRIGARVHRVGRVSESELASLYRTCLAYCSPTRGEGFGFTVLEAASAGAPVLASDLPILREVMEAAFEPVTLDDVAAWSSVLTSVARDDRLRADLASAGRARASRFTWKAAATATTAAYDAAWETATRRGPA